MTEKILKWFSHPTFEGDEEKTRVASLLNIIILVFIASAILYGIISPIETSAIYLRVLLIAPFVLVLVGLKQAVNWGYVRWAGILIVTSLWALFTSSMLFGSTIDNPSFMGYTVVVVCAGLFLNWRAAIGWGVFSILTGGATLLLEEYGITSNPQFHISAFSFWVAEAFYILVITVLLSETTRRIAESSENAKRELAERKRVQVERESVIKELETKNAELERFTYTVSHDLKSPLVTISGFVGMLEIDANRENKEKLKLDIQRIREAAEKMHRLLNELLGLSRIGRMINPPEEIPFANIVAEALELTRGHFLGKNIKVNIQNNLPMVRGDRPRLVEVVQNLLDNAVKFTGNRSDPQIEIGYDFKKEKGVFFVKDNGIGIEPSYHGRIFGLFDKLDPNSEGTGVGLALVKRIIEVHNGQIWVESEGKGQGSCFYFSLPTII